MKPENFDPAKTAEYEAARWFAIDNNNIPAAREAHKAFLQAHFGLDEKITEELTQIRMLAGNARQEAKGSADPRMIEAARSAAVYHLTEYYTRLQEETKTK
jgi:hypothetical protein